MEGEKSKAEEIARNMKSIGIGRQIIQQVTGLADAEIEAL